MRKFGVLSAAYYEACEEWVDKVANLPLLSSVCVLIGRREPEHSESADPRMALTIADMPSYKWGEEPIPLVIKRAHKSQTEQEAKESAS
jgi:hypothetical protein